MDLITEDEIRRIRKNAVKFNRVKILEVLKKGKFLRVKIVALGSGYSVGMSINDADIEDKDFPLTEDEFAEHISIGCTSTRRYEPVDPADAEIIARAILGDGYKPKKGMLNNCLHFIKKKKKN